MTSIPAILHLVIFGKVQIISKINSSIFKNFFIFFLLFFFFFFESVVYFKMMCLHHTHHTYLIKYVKTMYIFFNEKGGVVYY